MMAPAWLQGPLLTLVLLFSGGCYAQVPNPGLPALPCTGNRQSPIDIIADKTTHNPKLGPVSLSGYGANKKLLTMLNTGTKVYIDLGDGLHLSGHGLPAPYTAKNFHFSWGNGNAKPGSEHFIGGKQYAMELQVFHTKNNMAIQDAIRDPEGIAALGFFVHGQEAAQDKTAEAWKALTDYLPRISTNGQFVNLNGAFTLLDLLGSTDLGRYYRYLGSLTDGACNEVVIWTIFTEPILVSPEVVEAFPKLYASKNSSGPHLVNNFRPLQKIGDRVVEASASLKDEGNHESNSSLDAQPAKFFLLLFITLTFFLPV